jgi:hypothetical protein
MSYSKKYKERIAVPYSGSVRYNYPASEKGGTATVHYNGTTYEDVYVNIDVDTAPFDRSVEQCNGNVNLLTGAVVAAETAQIISIDKNAKKVAKTVIDGFFGYIRSEISQQIAELTQNIDAQLMHLKELAVSCAAKKKQMEGDFLRIAGRYTKIFEDLNNELSNRVRELDKSAFVFRKELDSQKIRSGENDIVNTVSVFGKEGHELQARIAVSLAKKRTLDALSQARVFLYQQKKLNDTIASSMSADNVSRSQYTPICFIETTDGPLVNTAKLYTPTYLSGFNQSSVESFIKNEFSSISNKWGTISGDHAKNVKRYFNAELNSRYGGGDQRSLRIRDLISKMATDSAPKTITY